MYEKICGADKLNLKTVVLAVEEGNKDGKKCDNFNKRRASFQRYPFSPKREKQQCEKIHRKISQ